MMPKLGLGEPVEPALAGGRIQQAAFFSMGRRYDVRGALKRVAAPVLVLAGDRDPARGPSLED